MLPDRVIDESLDIMVWALRQRDPDGWLDMPEAGWDWIARCDGPFKAALDRTKYATRYPGSDPEAARAQAEAFLAALETALAGDDLFARPSLAEAAILPFVRQFAFIDKPRFDAAPWPLLQARLERFLDSPGFAAIMGRYPAWQEGEQGLLFPPPGAECALLR